MSVNGVTVSAYLELKCSSEHKSLRVSAAVRHPGLVVKLFSRTVSAASSFVVIMTKAIPLTENDQ